MICTCTILQYFGTIVVFEFYRKRQNGVAHVLKKKLNEQSRCNIIIFSWISRILNNFLIIEINALYNKYSHRKK